MLGNFSSSLDESIFFHEIIEFIKNGSLNNGSLEF